jgi:hypothetical protein
MSKPVVEVLRATAYAAQEQKKREKERIAAEKAEKLRLEKEAKMANMIPHFKQHVEPEIAKIAKTGKTSAYICLDGIVKVTTRQYYTAYPAYTGDKSRLLTKEQARLFYDYCKTLGFKGRVQEVYNDTGRGWNNQSLGHVVYISWS